MPQHGTVVWTELETWDVDAAKDFYADTLGWTYQSMPMEDPDGGIYWIIMSGETRVGGLYQLQSPQFDGIPAHWFTFIEVDDIDARLALVEAAGGEIKRPAFDVPGVGRIAIVKDASGAVVGWVTSSEG
ncbi:27 kDa antigen Cfp30B [Hartmannibacter diazotrophicus]|uniref:27 kDa antigen Cfp30B n=1 Tax=Hartmannibacter diazotrophicus TaxID=1482074 RepID=A0A2C9D9W0_9HYPH|nr:VOC family protein [Hartmannibacter diazotrophicus]SON57077.1 27 kDa antigen Cfp30B [Hartmannibacter diazotrophicus]